MWNLHERVLAVEELRESHGGAHMAKVLHEVLVNYNLTDKVRFLFMFLCFFCAKYLFYAVFCNYGRSLMILQVTIGLWQQA